MHKIVEERTKEITIKLAAVVAFPSQTWAQHSLVSKIFSSCTWSHAVQCQKIKHGFNNQCFVVSNRVINTQYNYQKTNTDRQIKKYNIHLTLFALNHIIILLFIFYNIKTYNNYTSSIVKYYFIYTFLHLSIQNYIVFLLQILSLYL